ncbi:hypothetical protein DMUE_5515 [Dictyocoela muelleri]|nr:hypothetical protein DMUE_5515 [Dictyocoela muelleri]
MSDENAKFENFKPELIKINKNKEYVLYLKYYYYFQNKNNTITTCNCSKRPCEEKLKREGDIVKYTDESKHECISLTPSEIKRIIGMKKMKNMANNSCLNNKQIISEIFKNLDESEIASLFKQKSLNRTIFNERQMILNNYDNTDDIPEELKLSINCGKFLHYDSGCLDSERLLIFINSEKKCILKTRQYGS